MSYDNQDETERRIARYTHRALYRELKMRARFMRKHPTPAEALLWQHLRHRRVGGYHSRRQHPVVRYIVDFYCAEAKLAIEVDGSVHDEPGHNEYDMARQAFLEKLGLRVLRFHNCEVLRGIDAVVKTISDTLQSTPPPAPTGGQCLRGPRLRLRNGRPGKPRMSHGLRHPPKAPAQTRVLHSRLGRSACA